MAVDVHLILSTFLCRLRCSALSGEREPHWLIFCISIWN